MKILSIETSCDETGISILEIKGGNKNPSFRILADSLNSQIKIHAPFGGVYPMLAKREHIKNLPILFARTLKKAKLDKSKKPFDLIAVTSGPGLEPALWTGITFAQETAKKYNVPVIPVNHMEGHILSVFGNDKKEFIIPVSSSKSKQTKINKGAVNFPILSLLVSGGHTELVLIQDWMKYKVLGETLDDAAGEAFDKVARMLGLPYPGGPEISKLAEVGRKSRNTVFKSIAQADGPSIAIRQQADMCGFKNSIPAFSCIPTISLPRPMMHSKNFDFSFSGLKTAVLYLIRDLTKVNPDILKDEKMKIQIATEFENAVVETLVHKTKKAIEKYNIKTVITAGGVSSNKYLRKEMKKMAGSEIKILFPEKKLATDNSIMIGIAGYFRFLKKGKKISSSKIKAEGHMHL
ncbi:MAG: tRNA (adenosine(37)-N6)-threonylcarbamoyltransferase complex transferase subunit TsaD [Minisyncoccia bacterium]